MSESAQVRVKRTQTRAETLMLAFLAALAVSAILSGLLFAGWAAYGLLSGGFGYNDLWRVVGNLISLFVASTLLLTMYLAFRNWRRPM